MKAFLDYFDGIGGIRDFAFVGSRGSGRSFLVDGIVGKNVSANENPNGSTEMKNVDQAKWLCCHEIPPIETETVREFISIFQLDKKFCGIVVAIDTYIPEAYVLLIQILVESNIPTCLVISKADMFQCQDALTPRAIMDLVDHQIVIPTTNMLKTTLKNPPPIFVTSSRQLLKSRLDPSSINDLNFQETQFLQWMIDNARTQPTTLDDSAPSLSTKPNDFSNQSRTSYQDSTFHSKNSWNNQVEDDTPRSKILDTRKSSAISRTSATPKSSSSFPIVSENGRSMAYVETYIPSVRSKDSPTSPIVNSSEWQEQHNAAAIERTRQLDRERRSKSNHASDRIPAKRASYYTSEESFATKLVPPTQSADYPYLPLCRLSQPPTLPNIFVRGSQSEPKKRQRFKQRVKSLLSRSNRHREL